MLMIGTLVALGLLAATLLGLLLYDTRAGQWLSSRSPLVSRKLAQRWVELNRDENRLVRDNDFELNRIAATKLISDYAAQIKLLQVTHKGDLAKLHDAMRVMIDRSERVMSLRYERHSTEYQYVVSFRFDPALLSGPYGDSQDAQKQMGYMIGRQIENEIARSKFVQLADEREFVRRHPMVVDPGFPLHFPGDYGAPKSAERNPKS